jgi:hypothetical protein
VLVVTRNDLFQIPRLNALTSSPWDSQAMRLGLCAGVYRLPSCVELLDNATLLADLVRFTLHPEGFRLPADWKRSFQLVRCADFWKVDSFLQFVAKTLHVETTALNSAIPIRQVRHLHRSQVSIGLPPCRKARWQNLPVVLHQPRQTGTPLFQRCSQCLAVVTRSMQSACMEKMPASSV